MEGESGNERGVWLLATTPFYVAYMNWVMEHLALRRIQNLNCVHRSATRASCKELDQDTAKQPVYYVYNYSSMSLSFHEIRIIYISVKSGTKTNTEF